VRHLQHRQQELLRASERAEPHRQAADARLQIRDAALPPGLLARKPCHQVLRALELDLKVGQLHLKRGFIRGRLVELRLERRDGREHGGELLLCCCELRLLLREVVLRGLELCALRRDLLRHLAVHLH
jgi:hypothetical protein